MKLQYNIQYDRPKFDVEQWLNDNKPNFSNSDFPWATRIEEEYEEIVTEFTSFLKSTEGLEDSTGVSLKPVDVYNAVEYYKIRITKINLIMNLKLYKTHNVNKETKVRYIVMRATWIDNYGKPYRYFSKNLGAEHKVLVNGKIPVKVMESIEEYIRHVMWDQYYLEYIDGSESGYDEDGNLVIPDDF